MFSPPVLGVVFALLLCLSAAAPANPVTEILAPAEKVEQKSVQPATISADSSPSRDRAIGERLQRIYSELDDLQSLRVHVSNGVVTLSGTVGEQASEENAVRLAAQVDGVVEVKNRLVVNVSFKRRLDQTYGRLQALAADILGLAPLLALAVIVVVIFWWLGVWASARRGLLAKLTANSFIVDLIAQVVRLLFLLTGVVLALSLLNATSLIGTLLGAAGIIGLAVGFAVRDTVENYIASILLSVRRPFALDELVDIAGVHGRVTRLTSRATVLISPEGNHIRIPNATVFKSTITNYSRNPLRRFEFDVGVDTAQDLLSVQALALQVMDSVAGVLSTPAPETVIKALGDSNVVLRIYGWMDQASHDFNKVRSETIRAVKSAFDEAGVGMPEPTYNLRMTQLPPDAAAEKKTSTQAPTGEYAAAVRDTKPEKPLGGETGNGRTGNLLENDAPSEI